ncbi:MAG TPA: alkaline phosphatase family protein [Solirubrobacteraceae bacterium]
MLRSLDQLTLPPPWVRGLLVLAFLGFGVLVGNVTSGAATSAATPQAHLRLMLPPAIVAAAPATTPSTPTATPTPTAPASTGESEPAATDSPSAGTGASSGSGGSGSSGSGSSGGGSGGSGSGSGAGEGGGGGAGSGSGASGSAKRPAIKHVFLIVLADQPYAAMFGPASKATYLAGTLEKQGELLVRYYAVAHDELANGIALISGQAPTAQTALNCPTFNEIAPAPGAGAADGQVTGQGCVYPSSTETLAGQLTAKHLTWRAYVEGMTPACAHPALGAADSTVGAPPPPSATPGPANQATPADQAAAGAQYTTFRNPFLYFHSIIDSGPACAADDVGIQQLASDLKSAKRTPAFSYIVPSLCDDGGPTPCSAGQAAGAVTADAFLKKVVPEITTSKAFKNGGLLAITVDQAPATGVEADSSSCCGQPRFPNLPAPAPLPGGGQLPPSGGGQVGALLLSRFVKAGAVDQDPYNHFSLLRTIEDLFGLKHLGYAAASGVSSFGASVFEGR